MTSTSPSSVEEYINSLPQEARDKFNELRLIVSKPLPQAEEFISYKILGYRVNGKPAFMFISGWKDHVALYPLPDDKDIEERLAPYKKGKGTAWFSLNEPLPQNLIEDISKLLLVANK